MNNNTIIAGVIVGGAVLAAAGAIALMTTVANLGGFLGPYAVGVLKERSGSFQGGLLLLAAISLAGSALALWLRRSPVLRPTSSVTSAG